MARYTGPRDKISRRFGVPVFGPSKYLERKNYPPGTHGPRARRKHSDYALALMEKQKLRFHYGLMEKQFRSIYEKARRHRGVTGEIMLQLLESRLDNIVYRLGFGATRAQARRTWRKRRLRTATRSGERSSTPRHAGTACSPFRRAGERTSSAWRCATTRSGRARSTRSYGKTCSASRLALLGESGGILMPRCSNMLLLSVYMTLWIDQQ